MECDSASSLITEVEAGRGVALALSMLKLVAGKRLLLRPLTGTSEVVFARENDEWFSCQLLQRDSPLPAEPCRVTFRRMKTNRIEAFSDGVIAILITIMVLELKAPHDPNPASLAKMWPTFFAYVLSFIIIAIYWVNHHHLIHLVTRVDSVILWANINLLFWISLIPGSRFISATITRCHFR